MLWPMLRVPELFTNLRVNFNIYKAKTDCVNTTKSSRPLEISYKSTTQVIILPDVSLQYTRQMAYRNSSKYKVSTYLYSL